MEEWPFTADMQELQPLLYNAWPKKLIIKGKIMGVNQAKKATKEIRNYWNYCRLRSL